MGFFSNFFDDVLGVDPNGGGLFNVLGSGTGNLFGGVAGGLTSLIPGVGPFLAPLAGSLTSGIVNSQGGGAGFNSQYLSDYVAELTKQQEAAKAANEARYSEIRGNLRGQRRQARVEEAQNLNYLRGQRKEAKQQNAQRFNELGTQVQQNLVGRGLTNTTIFPTMQFALEGERRRAATNIDNTYNRQLLDQRRYGQSRIDGISNNLLRFKEARTDAYPDLSGLTSLAQQYGQAQGNDRARLGAQIQGALAGLGQFGQGQHPYYSPTITPTPGYTGLPNYGAIGQGIGGLFNGIGRLFGGGGGYSKPGLLFK